MTSRQVRERSAEWSPRSAPGSGVGLRSGQPRVFGSRWARSPGLAALLAGALLAGALLVAAGCHAPVAVTAREPVPQAASDAMLEAWTLSRTSGFSMGSVEFERAADQARLAARLAPDWAAPERFLDRWYHRSSLTLPDRLAAYLTAAEMEDSRAIYLAARLGGSGSRAQFERAAALDPSFSWAWHGQAWAARRALRMEAALAAGCRALALSRDPSEVALFAWSLGTYLDASKREVEAIEVLRVALSVTGELSLREPERAMVGSLLSRLLLGSPEGAKQTEGVAQATEWIASPWLTDRERLDLVEALLAVGQPLISGAEIELALAQGVARLSGDSRRAATELLEAFRRGARPVTKGTGWRTLLVEAFGSRGPLASAGGGGARSDAGPQGGGGGADGESPPGLEGVLDAWCADLPSELKDDAGAPLDPELLALMEAVRALGVGAPSQREGREVGERLLAAGWFSEAVGWAGSIAPVDPEGARDLEVAALRGRAALGALLNLGRRLDAMAAFASAGASGGRITSAVELHDEVARILERCGWLDLPDGGFESPVISYGPAGSIVHPGPSFSEEDGRLGRGAPGAPVPGLAAAFEAMGRFALVGRGAGQGGPDATVLRRLHAQPRAGAHLGRPFEGVAIWCQGADVPGRITRRGGAIAGAALHEGFYIDLEVIALERAYCASLLRAFSAPGGEPDRGALARALAVPAASPAPVMSLQPALGAADRMRLAVMCDRSPGDPVVPPLDLFTEGVVAHEEAHLCDRKAWYPLTAPRVLRLIAFAAGQGFSGGRIAEALEERAQLVALAVLEDPRLMWVDLLDAADQNFGGGGAPHGAAYRRLLRRLIERMQAESLRGGWADLPGAGARWIDRLHLAAPEDLRALALREARSAGLTR